MTKQQVRRINNILSVLVAVAAVYIISLPLFPEISSLINRLTDHTNGYKYASAAAAKALPADTNLPPPPTVDTLVIPSIGVNGEVYESATTEALGKGMWHKPFSSNPEKGGNTVIIAHRYLHGDVLNSFYNLPKVSLGDTMVLFWNGKEYDYQVYEKREVDPSEVSIEADTGEPILTLYTCTPLFTSTRRIVIRAKLESY